MRVSLFFFTIGLECTTFAVICHLLLFSSVESTPSSALEIYINRLVSYFYRLDIWSFRFFLVSNFSEILFLLTSCCSLLFFHSSLSRSLVLQYMNAKNIPSPRALISEKQIQTRKMSWKIILIGIFFFLFWLLLDKEKSTTIILFLRALIYQRQSLGSRQIFIMRMTSRLPVSYDFWVPFL